MQKDLKKMVKALEDQGFECLTDNKGHVRVFLNGRQVAIFAGTPSDRRGWLNSLSDVKRHGFRWPPPR